MAGHSRGLVQVKPALLTDAISTLWKSVLMGEGDISATDMIPQYQWWIVDTDR
ncbi:hypothetical protein ACU6TU_10675 [Halomonas sp. LS-001]